MPLRLSTLGCSLLIGLLLIFSSFSYGGDYIHFQWWLGTIFLGVFFLKEAWELFFLNKKILALLLVSLYYLFVNGIYVSTYRYNRFSGNPSDVKALFAYISLEQIFFVSFILAVLYCIKNHVPVLRAIGYWGLANSLYTIHGYIDDTGILKWGIGYSGFINYASVNGCLIASSIPFFPKMKKWYAYLPQLLGVLAVFLSKSSVPVGALFLALAVPFFGKYLTLKNVFRGSLLVLFGTLLFFGASFLIDKNLFDSGHRFQAYKIFMSFWWNHANVFTGFGPGTFKTMAPGIQESVGFMLNRQTNLMQYWVYMHSDWPLQLLYEEGLLGLLLSTTILIMVSYTLIKNKAFHELGSLSALIGSCLFNFPLRYFPGAMILGALLLSAINLENEKGEV